MLPILETHIFIYQKFGKKVWVFWIPAMLLGSLILGVFLVDRMKAVGFCETVFIIWPQLNSALMIFVLTPVVLMVANIFLRLEKRKGNAWDYLSGLVFAGLFLWYATSTVMAGVLIFYDPSLAALGRQGLGGPIIGFIGYLLMIVIIVVWKERYKGVDPKIYSGDFKMIFPEDGNAQKRNN